jgi:hypothetical protein
MDNGNVTYIDLSIIKLCGMYTKEYKNRIRATINSFKKYWANSTALVNQAAVPASQHGYGMTTVETTHQLHYMVTCL